MFNKQAIGFKLASIFLLVQYKCDDPRGVQYDPRAVQYDPRAFQYDPRAAQYDPRAVRYDRPRLFRLGKLKLNSGTADSATLSERFSVNSGTADSATLSERFSVLLRLIEVLKEEKDLDAFKAQTFKAQTGQLSKAQQEYLTCLVARIRAAKEQRKSTQELQQQELQDATRSELKSPFCGIL